MLISSVMRKGKGAEEKEEGREDRKKEGAGQGETVSPVC